MKTNLRIPIDAGRSFRLIPDTDSGSSRTPQNKNILSRQRRWLTFN
jgi:hypothetical protein